MLPCMQATDPPVILYASSGGNIHSFRARKPTAILDLLAPPYDIENPGETVQYDHTFEQIIIFLIYIGQLVLSDSN